LESEQKLRPNVTKSLVKGTIALAALSVFLQINPKTYLNYLIFLGLSYAIIGAYMFNKGWTTYTVGDSGVLVKRLYGGKIDVAYDNIQGLGVSQGMLAKRFGCGTVYVELKKGKGTHRSPGGYGVVAMKDIPDPHRVYEELEDRMSPFGAST
jgi:hypothetical protein